MQLIKIVILINFLSIFPASAYIGPGIGAGIIATVIGFIITLIVALFVILYYPIKKIILRLKKKRKKNDHISHITSFNHVN